MTWLAERYTLFAPDLRGFGDSDKPAGPFGPDQHAADMLALMDALDLKQAGVVGHDIGGALMQPMVRKAPQRVAGLFFFDFVYPGIGPPMAVPGRLNNIWYQSFNPLARAPSMIRCFLLPGPTGLGKPSPPSISRCFRGWDTSRIARIPIAPPQRSRRSSRASAGAETHGNRWDRQTRQKPAVPCRVIEIFGRE